MILKNPHIFSLFIIPRTILLMSGMGYPSGHSIGHYKTLLDFMSILFPSFGNQLGYPFGSPIIYLGFLL